MSRNDPTIDDILRELELTTAQNGGSGDPEVDALVQDLMEERQQPGIDPNSGKELPTRVFLQSSKKKRTPVPAASQQENELELLLTDLLGSSAAKKDAPPADTDETEEAAAPTEKAAPPSAQSKKEEGSLPEADPKPESAPKAVSEEKTVSPKQSEPEAYVTGPISIDIDAIRSGSPAPKAIPAQKLDEIEDGPLSQEESEKSPESSKPERRLPGPDQKRYAPCFRKTVLEEDAGNPSGLENIFRKINTSSRARGWVLMLLLVLALVLTFLMEQSRRADLEWFPSHVLMSLMTVLGIGAGAAAWPIISGGLVSLLKLEENRDTLPALGWLMTMGQALTLTIWPRGFIHPYIHCYLPVGILLLAVSCLGRILAAGAGLRNLRFLHSEDEKYIPHLVEDKRLAAELVRGLSIDGSLPVSNRRAIAVTDLATTSLASDSSDRLSRLLALLGLIAGAVSALIGFFVTKQKHFAVTLFTAVYLFFASALLAVLTAYPVFRTARRMEAQRGIVSGESSSDAYRNAGAVMVEARQLIPPDFITLAAIKTFEGTRLDDILVDAASVLHGTDSVLTELFARVIGQRKALLREVDNVEVEDTFGISGWVGGKRILIGSRAMMTSYDIRIPSKEYERRYVAKGHDLVYLAAAGELAAIFVLTIHPPIQATEAAQSLTDSGLGLIVSTVDSFVTAERLGNLFGINPAMIKILPKRLQPYAKRLAGEVRVKQALVVNDGSISGLSGCLTSARQLRTMITLNRVLAVTSVVLGCILMLIFSLLGAMQYLNPILFCGYAAVWLVLSWLLQKIFR